MLCKTIPGSLLWGLSEIWGPLKNEIAIFPKAFVWGENWPFCISLSFTARLRSFAR